MIIVEITGYTNNWWSNYRGKKFVVTKHLYGMYKVVCPYPNSFKMPDQYYLNTNGLSKSKYLLPKEGIKIVKKLPSNMTVRKISYERLIVKK